LSGRKSRCSLQNYRIKGTASGKAAAPNTRDQQKKWGEVAYDTGGTRLFSVGAQAVNESHAI